VWDQLGHRELDRLAAELERSSFGEVLIPVDALLVTLGFELGVPLLV
jgi:hypothetical protein